MISNNFKCTIYLIVASICTFGHGEELPDLVGRLQKLEANSPICAVVRVEECKPAAENKESPQQLEKVDLIITSDANVLTLSVKEDISNVRFFREFSLLRASELVHYGPSLARELAGLELIEKLFDLYEGTSCTLWRLHSKEKKSQFGISATRRSDVELWIDNEGYPVAASFKMREESKILLFKMSRESTCQQRYKRLRHRHILTFDKQDETVEQGKEKGGKRIVTTTVEVKRCAS